MRQIGTLPRSLNAKAFADHLLSLGIKNRIDERPEGWDVWIFDEDHVPRSRDELRTYLEHPEDPRYREATRTAEAIRRNEKDLDRKFRKNFRDSSDIWGSPTLRRRPVTTLLVVACVMVFFLQNTPRYRRVVDKLEFSSFTPGERGDVQGFDLDDIAHGQAWRLVTPSLMHGGLIHLLLNMIMLQYFGTRIEVRRGTIRLGILVLVSAAISNLGQYLYMERINDVHPFEGMSGVIYALFGYAWMKGMYQPEQQLAVHPNTVNIMLIWLVVCMSGAIEAIGPIANAAHFVGLAVGIIAGVLGL